MSSIIIAQNYIGRQTIPHYVGVADLSKNNRKSIIILPDVREVVPEFQPSEVIADFEEASTTQ